MAKLKKFLKKAGKAAAVAAALYGATKLGRKRATDAPGNAAAAAKKLLTSDRAYTGKGYDDHIIRQPKLTSPVDEGIWGSPWGAKGGGIAKRGMGAAFKKGGHVKSMGIAKRGGGAAKR
mgnify:FL=1